MLPLRYTEVFLFERVTTLKYFSLNVLPLRYIEVFLFERVTPVIHWSIALTYVVFGWTVVIVIALVPPRLWEMAF